MTTPVAKHEYNLRNRVSPSSIADTVAIQLEEQPVVPHSVELFHEDTGDEENNLEEIVLPDDIEVYDDNIALITYLNEHLQYDMPVAFYLPAGTSVANRNFVLKTFAVFSLMRRATDYNANEAVIDGKVAANPLSSNTNGTAVSPLLEEFAKVEAIGSALVNVARKRNSWPANRRNKPKLFIKLGESNSYFPFT